MPRLEGTLLAIQRWDERACARLVRAAARRSGRARHERFGGSQLPAVRQPLIVHGDDLHEVAARVVRGPLRSSVSRRALLSDWRLRLHAKANGALLGMGKVDFARVREALDAIDHRRWVEIEGAVPPGAPLVETCRSNLAYLRDVLRG